MGKVTEEFENKMATALQVPHVLATSNGSTALLMSLMALDIKPW
jgi:Predicted pyridoxal phosphate-dependent enzyme apparently involved in regulation of cell wall biogenesis